MIYLDSAITIEAAQAMSWGWVKGITTNPTLLTKADTEPLITIKTLVDICKGDFYYQIVSQIEDEMIREAHKAREIIGEKLVLKIPATFTGFAVLPKLASEINCSVTAIYHPTQAIIAAEGGAKCAIAYVNRATNLQGDGNTLISSMKQVLQGSETSILAASLKSPAEVATAVAAGADHVTLSFNLLKDITTHTLSQQTVTDFSDCGRGLTA